MKHPRVSVITASLLTVGAMLVAGSSAAGARPAAASPHASLNCEYSSLCTEVANSADVFGTEYVGHDEPSAVFYSNQPGSGNQMRYLMRLPRDPSPANPASKSYAFELNGAQWFGMAMCDTQSYPEQVSTCTPDSDSNIVDPTVSPNHPGTAFMEMQFYPPGWVPWPTWRVAIGASGCDPTKWCAALNVDSLSEDPVNGTFQNDTCASQVGLEYVNFAFITKNGKSQAPANPVDSTDATFTPNPAKDLFMNSGDVLAVTMHDTANGLRIDINDVSSGQSGSMTASASNGFAQIQYDPTGTSCNAIPYNFHPMYSTSSEQTRVPWAAHVYNIGYSSEIGHFETCNGPTAVPASPFGLDSSGNPITCPAGNVEGLGTGTPTDGDDDFCFPGTEAMLVNVNGCTDTNAGFDSLAYQPVWPDGNLATHAEPVLFTSPRTGSSYTTPYSRMAFEADLPRIEGTCNRTTGAGCTLIPTTDQGTPAAFYPFYSAFQSQLGCAFAFGNTLPGANNFGANAQYGTLLSSTYLAFGGGGATINRINNFRQILSPNPC
jgi:hypothetical protein